MSGKGVVWVAIGPNAERELTESRKSLLEHNRLHLKVFDPQAIVFPIGLSADQQAHWAKVNTDKWSPFEYTLLLDADTRIHGDLSIGFKMLYGGWEVVLAPSFPQGSSNQVLWNLHEEERRVTLQELGVWKHIMFNTGVLFFRKTPRVRALFDSWRVEWLRYKDRDQGAFLRALRNNPVQLWLLGAPFNSAGGEVIEHLFGRAR